MHKLKGKKSSLLVSDLFLFVFFICKNLIEIFCAIWVVMEIDVN